MVDVTAAIERLRRAQKNGCISVDDFVTMARILGAPLPLDYGWPDCIRRTQMVVLYVIRGGGSSNADEQGDLNCLRMARIPRAALI